MCTCLIRNGIHMIIHYFMHKSMKRTLASALAATIALGAMAIPAKKGLKIQATDIGGNPIEVSLVGDEHFHYYVAADGTPMEYCADGKMQPLSEQALKSRREAARSLRRQKASISDHNQSQVPHTGSPRIPIILVDYSDKHFLHGDDAITTFNEFFQQGAKSARQYFVDNSNGRFTPQFDVYGPFRLKNRRSYYGGYDYYGNDERPGTMVAEACLGLNDEIDFSLYDNNGDGECDVVIVLYAGDGQASSGNVQAVWPCQWSLYFSDYGRSLTLDGVRVNDFAVFNEVHGDNQNAIDGIGTFCHEFSHCLGLPDFYDTNYAGNYGMGPWSLMDFGSYNDGTYTPIGYSAYEKWFMGWIDDIPEPEPGSTLSFPIFNQKDIASDVAYRIINDSRPDEYFVMENRARQGWDEFIPAEGLMIYHVDYDRNAWDNNEVNDYSPERMAIVAADGRRTDETTEGDLYPYLNNNSFTDTSYPASLTNTRQPMRKPVTEISRDSYSGIVTCRFMADALPELDPPALDSENPPSEDVMAPTTDGFTAVWPAAETDLEVTYTLEVRPYSQKRTTLLVDGDFTQGSCTWDVDGYVNPEDNSLHVGSGKKIGAVISPTFEQTSADDISVIFRAKSYGNDYGVNLRVCLLNTSGTQIASESTAINSGFNDYMVKFPNIEAGSYRVKVETLAAGKRANLKWVHIYKGDASDELEDTPAQAANSETPDNPATETLLIEDIATTSYTVKGLTPGGIYNWRVRTVAVDDTQANPSGWSAPITVTLPGQSVITTTIADDTQTATYYDLTGRPVANPTSGIYIRRSGAKVEKIIMNR